MWRLIVVVLALAGCKDRYKQASSSMMPTLELGERVTVTKTSEVARGDVIVFDMPCEPHRRYLKRAIALGGDTVEIRCGVVHVNGKAIDTALVAASTTYEDLDPTSEDPRKHTVTVSRYRETHGGRSYEIFDSVDRPAAKQPLPAGRDFPNDEQPSCGAHHSTASATGGPQGQVVKTGEPDGCKLHAHYVVPDRTIFVLGDNRGNSNDSRFWGVVPMPNLRGRVDP